MGLFMAVPTRSPINTLLMGTSGSLISETEGWKRREEYLKSGFGRCEGSETVPM
jgi:hypothetical protein